MQVHYGIKHLPVFRNTVITIGTFDGVHKGHKKVIEALINEAVEVGGESLIISFHPHPRKIVSPGRPLQLINTLEEKIELLSKTGIQHLVIVPFNTAFAEQAATQYVDDFLVNNFHPATIIIGYDHHFGKARSGNFALLAGKAVENNYRLKEIPKLDLDTIAVSSTQIRNAILESDIEKANRLLGYTFFFEGKVEAGDRLGRQLGYPTANLAAKDEDKILLGDGVYAVMVLLNEKKYRGMLSIGNRPTLADARNKVEVNIFDFEGEIYGENLRVYVHHFLRAQEKYPSLDALKVQLEKDKKMALALL